MRTRSFNLLLLLAAITSSTSFAQKTKAEQEVLKVSSDFEKAMLKGDVSFIERNLAPEFINHSSDGSSSNRSELLEGIKKEKATPTFKMSAATSEDVKVKVSGNLAVVTGAWKQTMSSLEADATPRTHRGYFTDVYEKRNGRWLRISDHATGKAPTPEEVEPDLRKASDDFDKAMETKNGALFEKLLADDFISTNETGLMRNKKEDIANMTSPDMVFTSIKSDDKKFRIYRGAAVETGRYTVTGTNKGKPFTETGRYTAAWVYKNGMWQMAADHTSVIPEKNTGAGAGN